MRNYYRLMLGRKSKHAEACLAGGFVGTDFGIHQDLTGRLPDEWRDFNKEFIPIYLDKHPDKTKIAAGWRAVQSGLSLKEWCKETSC